MTKKIPVCFTLKPENVEILKNAAGIATTSAFLDHMIEVILGASYSGKSNFKSILDNFAVGEKTPTTIEHPPAKEESDFCP